MARAHLILTDSGGIQEEAPALGKPTLVMRDRTERPEIVEGGSAMLTGADHGRIVASAAFLLDNPEAHGRMAKARSPFGDGRAAKQIMDILEDWKVAKHGI